MLFLKQIVKYGVVGLISNLALYCIYITLTLIGFRPVWAMSMVYAFGVVISFLLNKRWTFENSSTGLLIFLKFTLAYFIGYVVNLIGLFWWVDVFAWPHQVGQALMIFLVALILFALQKFWVFKNN